MSEMRNCPFCNGQPAECYDPNRVNPFFVFCSKCAVEGPAYGEKARTVEHWNTRPLEDQAGREAFNMAAEVVKGQDHYYCVAGEELATAILQKAKEIYG